MSRKKNKIPLIPNYLKMNFSNKFYASQTMSQDELVRNYSSDEGTIKFKIMGLPCTEFKIDYNNYVNFMKDYCSLVDQNKTLNICEVVPSEGDIPLTGNLIFNVVCDDVDKEFYNDKFVLSLVRTYQETIQQFFINQDSDDDPRYVCFFLYGAPVKQQDSVAFNLRVIFPWCRMMNQIYTNKFKPLLIQNLTSNKVFSNMFYQPLDSWNDIIRDFHDLHPGIYPLYGSRVDKVFPALKNYRIFSYIEEEEQDDEDTDFEIRDDDPDSGLDPSSHSLIFKSGNLRNNFKKLSINIDPEKRVSFWIALFLTHNYCADLLKVNPKYLGNKSSNKTSFPTEVLDSDLPKDIFEMLFWMINPERFRNRKMWKEIGEIIYVTYKNNFIDLYNEEFTGDDHHEGLDIFVRESKKSGISEEDCLEFWSEIKTGELKFSVKRIAEYAIEDNPEGYNAWHKTWYTMAFERAASEPSDENLGQCFYRLNWLKYVQSEENGKSEWYFFNGIRLVHITKPSLISNIRDSLAAVFKNLLTEKSIKLRDHRNNDSREKELADSISNLTKTIKQLQKNSTKTKIIEDASSRFHDSIFPIFRNRDKDLLCTRNCILSFENGRIVIRKGYIEDRITICTDVPYNTNYSKKHPKVRRVMELINQIMCYDKELVNRCWLKLASILEGGNKEKHLTVTSGHGDNGKSIFFKLIKLALGHYVVDIPKEVLMPNKNNAGKPHPELAQIDGVRLAVISESGRNSVFDEAMVKLYTGGDAVFLRKLFKDGGSIPQHQKIWMQTNNPPEFNGTGRAIKARIDLLPCLATFSDEYPDTLEEQIEQKTFPIVLNLEDEVKELGPAMLWCMVDQYPNYVAKGLSKNIPKIIQEYKHRYWEEKDMYLAFIIDAIQINYLDNSNRKKDLEKGEINNSEIYQAFQFWHRSMKPGKRVPDSSEVIDCLQDPMRLGTQDARRKWKGIQFKQEFLDQWQGAE